LSSNFARKRKNKIRFFLSGFASGFMSSAFALGRNVLGQSAIIARTAISAIIGGVSSMLAGGKFLNGAVSAAFVHMFNAEQKGFAEGVKEFGRMLGRAFKVITFQDKIYDEIPYDRVGNDAVRAVQNAHPAAKTVLVVAGAQVMLGGIYGAEATYFSVNANPLSAYAATEAALNPGVPSSIISSLPARLGQAIGYIARHLP
jgi:hypothetical protein